MKNQGLIDFIIFVVAAVLVWGVYMNHTSGRKQKTTQYLQDEIPRPSKEFPRLDNHIAGCLICRSKAFGEITLPLCEDGIELLRHDLHDRWEYVRWEE